MYKIYAGTDLIYSPSLAARAYIVNDPTLSIENNKPSTLTFSVPYINQKAALMELLNASGKVPEIKVYDGDRRIFRGRLITNEKDWLKSRAINAEGELAYLRDVIVRPNWVQGSRSVQNFFETLVESYNSIAEDGKHFEVGNCTVTGAKEDRSTDQYIDVLSHLTDKLLNVYGGFLQARVEIEGGVEVTYLDYLEEPGTGSQTIRYGRNLIDLVETATVAPVYTRIIPLGASQDNTRVTIPELYLTDTTAAAKYGLIESVQTYDDITDPNTLRIEAKKTLSEAVNPQNTLQLTAIDMSLFGDDSPLEVGKIYRILSAPHGYVESAQAGRLNRAEIKLAKVSESRYYFGNAKATITQEAVKTNRAMSQVTKLALDNTADIDNLRAQIEAIAGDITDIANFVSEEKDSGGWHIRVWHNGKVDAWTQKAVTMSAWTADEATATINLPTEVTTAGVIIVTGDQEAVYTASITNNQLEVTAKATTSFTDTNLNIYIGG